MLVARVDRRCYRASQGLTAASALRLQPSSSSRPDPAYRGDPSYLNPEQLVVLAAASCQLLSFLAEAARSGVDVVAYDDDAKGEMPDREDPRRMTSIVLRPRITVMAPVEESEVRELVEEAHRLCYIANSLRATIRVDPVIRVVPHDGQDGQDWQEERQG